LIDAGADVNAQYSQDGSIVTVARVVAAAGEPRLMQLLIDPGFVIHSDPEDLLLTIAASFGNRRVCEVLLNAAEWPKEERASARRALAEEDQQLEQRAL
jgi:hypothetical protein